MLLFDEQPIVYDRTLAKILKSSGADRAATVLQQVHYWVENNKKNHKYEAYVNGYWWSYRSIREWHEKDFSHWTYALVRSLFKSLRDEGLLIALPLSKDKSDRTNWYRINYEKLEKLYENFQNEKEYHLLKQTNGFAKKQQMESVKNQQMDLLESSKCNKENNKRLNKENNISSHQSNNNIIYSEQIVENDERLIEEDKKSVSSRKKCNTQYFRDSFGYSRVSKNKQVELDKWIKYAVDICLMLPNTKLHIGKQAVTAGDVAKRLGELRYEHIDYIFARLSQVSYPTNHKNYMLAVLFNAKEQYESSKSTFTGANNAQGRYVAPMPDYLQKRVNNRGKSTGERIITDEDNAAYNAMMEALNGKERNDV